MGADFVFTLAPEAVFDNHRRVQKFSEIQDEVFERIINDESIQVNIADMIFQREVEEMGEDAWLESLQIIDDYFYVMANPPRDCATFMLQCSLGHPTRVYVATGGFSWGDSPTDSFDSVYFFECTGLLDQPFRTPKDS